MRHDVGDTGNGFHDFGHGFAGIFCLTGTGSGTGYRVFDEDFDLFCRIRAALRQVTDLIRHHRETTAVFTGTGSFNCRVQGQNIGLERNAVDNGSDIGNFL